MNLPAKLCKDALLARCPVCQKLLAKRVVMHDEAEEVRVLHIKHRGLEIFTSEAVIHCPACRTISRVSGKDGVTNSISQ